MNDNSSPVILVKENERSDIREFYDLGANASLGSGMSGVVKRITRKSDGWVVCCVDFNFC